MQALPHIDERFDRLEPFTRPGPYPMRVGLIATLVFLAKRDFAERGGEPYALIEAEVVARLRPVEDLELAKTGRHPDRVSGLVECGRCEEWIHPVGLVGGRLIYAGRCAYCDGPPYQDGHPYSTARLTDRPFIGLVTAS